MKPWLDCSEIPTELLINPLVTLRNDFVGILDEATANAGHPCPHAPAAFSPTVHAFSIQGYIRIIIVLFW